MYYYDVQSYYKDFRVKQENFHVCVHSPYQRRYDRVKGQQISFSLLTSIQ